MADARIKPKSPCLSARTLLSRWLARGRMNQTEAAEHIGISRVKLNQYLSGVARPSLETAIRLEDVTGIGVRLWLLDEPMVTTDVPSAERMSTGRIIADEITREEEREVNNNLPDRTPEGVEK